MQANNGIQSLVQGWNTVRYELLNMRLCDRALRIEGSPLEPHTRRVHRELEARKVYFKPGFYLTDAWGCPDRVPVIGVPFYLADQRLARLEEEQSGEIEDGSTIMKFLCHEAGHAFNYAYELYKSDEWKALFPETSLFLPAAREICRRHGLSASALERMPGGSTPVFAIGRRLVLKVYCPYYRTDFAAELASLRAAHGSLTVPVPEVVAHGSLEGCGRIDSKIVRHCGSMSCGKPTSPKTMSAYGRSVRVSWRRCLSG